jgi:hypothetical protein
MVTFELKRLVGNPAAALELAERSRVGGEPEDAESFCLDVLEVEPDNPKAVVLLLLARTDLLGRGLPGGVERAREVLSRLPSDYDRAYYGGVICERQAKYLVQQRGRRSSFVAYEWFEYAMEQYEAAASLDPQRPEPLLRWNACARLIMRNPHCARAPEELEEHGLE